MQPHPLVPRGSFFFFFKLDEENAQGRERCRRRYWKGLGSGRHRQAADAGVYGERPSGTASSCTALHCTILYFTPGIPRGRVMYPSDTISTKSVAEPGPMPDIFHSPENEFVRSSVRRMVSFHQGANDNWHKRALVDDVYWSAQFARLTVLCLHDVEWARS